MTGNPETKHDTVGYYAVIRSPKSGVYWSVYSPSAAGLQEDLTRKKALEWEVLAQYVDVKNGTGTKITRAVDELNRRMSEIDPAQAKKYLEKLLD
ncbi:MAG TPA: hypothetical protein VJI68_00135 [Candidatus Nanoarchaeia archaeon]|nr:hypothetical protein [Candidatus Nanoarchaeia archaeon]